MKTRSFVAAILSAIALALSGLPVNAQQAFDISCEGVESTGGGNNRYQYTLRNILMPPQNALLTTFCIGTEDPIVANYTNVVMPPGWTFGIVANGTGPCSGGFTTTIKTPHGTVPPMTGSANTWQMVFSGPALMLAPGGMATFSFHNYHCSWDVEWFATGPTGGGQGFPNLPIAGPIGTFNNGWVHAPSIFPPAPTPFCDASDGSLVSCPCGNAGLPNTGCDIAQATGGVGLTVTKWSPDCMGGGTAVLIGTGYPVTGTPGAVVIRAPTLDTASPVVFGDGLRCVNATVVRLGATLAVGGQSTHPVMHGAGPGTFYYQIWFRNQPAMFCTPAAFNLSNGLSIFWP